MDRDARQQRAVFHEIGMTFIANLRRSMRVYLFMDAHLLDAKCARIGARLNVTERLSWRTSNSCVVSLDVQADRRGEFFKIVRQQGAEAETAILDARPADRHLLLLVRKGKDKRKFLCVHDDRHGFVAV